MTARLDGAGGAAARAGALVDLFCEGGRDFGSIEVVAPAAVPEPDRHLLDHHSHMTVAMERHHGCAVELRVVSERGHAGPAADAYAREILLVRPDGAVVQHGIVRIDLGVLDRESAAAIRRHAAPLGRILMAAGLLCEVHHVELLRIEPGPHLRRLVGNATRLHGRVAEISVAGRPAIELLEIVVSPPAASPVSTLV